jgi:hypothetical protein
MKTIDLKDGEIEEILTPRAIRDRAEKILSLSQKGGTSFAYHPEKLNSTVDYVLSVIRRNYPDLKIPFHSRWGHFQASGVDRVAKLNSELKSFDPLERARIKLDLVITSVLLDAGSGPGWSYSEKETGKAITRSEGLGVASFHMFMSKVMSSDSRALRADSAGLKKVSERDLEMAFQVSPSNPLVGVNGRVLLLNNLALALENKTIFKDGRPGNILDYLVGKYGKTIPATGLLRAVLDGLGPIWPGRLVARKKNLGDVWVYSGLGEKNTFASLVPFHKLSQWLTYSLIEPILEAGLKVTGVHELTGLAEYRNGGLILDAGLVSLRNAGDANRTWRPESDLIIEWRALTVALLDRIGLGVRKGLSKSEEEFPLAKVLEGGTWWAGRFLAQDKRQGGGPPLQLESDGTVF